jgi:hypothetical protein
VPNRHFVGIHVGRSSLRARLLSEDGSPGVLVEKRFKDSRELGESLTATFRELATAPAWSALAGAAVGLDKGQRCSLPVASLQGLLPPGVSLVTMPAQQAQLLGAIPSAPSLLVSLGAELRLASIDSTNTYREFRLQEGGGHWWTQELAKLAAHSSKLQRALAGLGEPLKVMKALPRLLEGADFPAPDPVLKVRVDGLCATIAESCLGLSSRLPGIGAMSLAGFLHPGPMSLRISEGCAGHLRVQQARFPAEVGAALLGLALYKENEERRHLGKPFEDGQSAPDRWAVPTVLVRRLFKLRRPFDSFAPHGGGR